MAKEQKDNMTQEQAQQIVMDLFSMGITTYMRREYNLDRFGLDVVIDGNIGMSGFVLLIAYAERNSLSFIVKPSSGGRMILHIWNFTK